MNIDAKILNSISAKLINTFKRSYTMTRKDLFLGCKDGPHIKTNQCIYHINE
jgi:hypothetical protein